MKQTNEEAITLIALVITIIILIILAGVGIQTTIGEDGIITKTKQARQNILIAQEEEAKMLNALYDTLENGEDKYKPKTVEEWRNQGIYATENTILIDKRHNQVVIPDGFKVSMESDIYVANGVVIEDIDGNQFVWVPVGEFLKADGTKESITLGRYTFDTGIWDQTQKKYTGTGKETLIQSAEQFEEETGIENNYGIYKELVQSRISNELETLEGTNTTARNLSGFVKSVKINGGYYIGRYESSYRDGIVPYVKKSLSASIEAEKKEGEIWNYTTQTKAARACRDMYHKTSFETDLVNSYAYDTAIVFIQKCSNDKSYSIKDSFNDSLKNTGREDESKDEKCKINDLASNLYEWTTEYCTRIEDDVACPGTCRGGRYYNHNGLFYTSVRESIGSTSLEKSAGTSFRPILYTL